MAARTSLVGREGELGQLAAALDEAARGHGRVYLVGGEPGIGKTSLLEALAQRAEPTEVRVLWGRCWEAGGAPAYWPWIQVLRAAAAGARPHALAALLGTDGPFVAQLVPELAERVSGLAPASPSESPGARFRLFDAVAGFIARVAAEEAPLAVALDDLHAADETSLLLLEFVAAEAPRLPLLVVGAYRDAEVRASPHLAERVAAVARHGARIGLGGLARPDVEALWETLTGEAPSRELGARVYERTDGNPLLVKEVARLLAAGGTAALRPERLPLPEEAHAIVARRLAPLAAALREVLAAAAVLGRDFDLAPLAAVLGGSPLELVDALGEARRQGVLKDLGGGRWSFAHALLREVLYEELSLSERARLHARAAEALAVHPGSDGRGRVTEVAHHRYEAARAAGGETEAEACAAAGAHAMASLAFEEAVGWYERAIEMLGMTAGADERRRYDLLVALGNARIRAGRFEDGRDAYQQALDIARSLSEPELLAVATLGFLHLRSGAPSKAIVELVHEALAALPETDSALRAQLLSTLSWLMDPSEWRHAATISDQALAMARRLRARSTLAPVLAQWLRNQVSFDPLGLVVRLDGAEELLRLTTGTNDRESAVMPRAALFSPLLEAGDLRAATRHATVAAREADEMRLPHAVGIARIMASALALIHGELDDAERLMRGALDAARVAEGELGQESLLAFSLFACSWQRGAFDEAWRLLHALSTGRTTAPTIPVGSNEHLKAQARALCAAIELGHNGTREQLETLVAEALAWDEYPVEGETWALLSHACWLLDSAGSGESLYETLRPYSGRLLTYAVLPLPMPLGAADRHLGQLATLLGRFDEAEAHFEAAHALHRRWAAPGFLAHGQADHARMLVTRDEREDQGRAAQLATAAADGFRSLGFTYYEEKASALASEARPRKPRPSSSPAVGQRGVLRAEGEYWCVAYGGQEVRLRDSKGVRYLARLLAEPGREFHALDLAGPPGAEHPREADAGAVLDPVAKAAYRRRLAEIDEELDEADAHHDLARAERAAAEREFLVAELTAAVGLGGRDRRGASAAERARQSVTRAVRGTIERLKASHPALGHHLATTIRTGTYCSYQPDPRVPISWQDG